MAYCKKFISRKQSFVPGHQIQPKKGRHYSIGCMVLHQCQIPFVKEILKMSKHYKTKQVSNPNFLPTVLSLQLLTGKEPLCLRQLFKHSDLGIGKYTIA